MRHVDNVLVLKLTGKVFDDHDVLVRHVENIRKLLLNGYSLVVVTGGGNIARRYIETAKELGVRNNYWLDLLGINASRLNSLLLISALADYSYPVVPVTIEEVLTGLAQRRLVVTGGLIPGQSTASALLEIAEAIGVRDVFYFSAIGKVYDKDPSRYTDAKPLSYVKASELKKILEQRVLPGDYALIDEKALDLALRSGIRIFILDYRYPEQLQVALSGGNPGSVIEPE